VLGELPVEPIVEVVFQCDQDISRQEWLKEQFPDCPVLYGEAERLGETKALNLRTDEYVAVPSHDLLIGGFSCTSRSKQSSNSSANKHCVREGREATGLTFQYLMVVLKKKHPECVILENVSDLAEGGDDSDREYILDCLTKEGYAADAYVIKAYMKKLYTTLPSVRLLSPPSLPAHVQVE
jgi:site-specific DNA-cytosine methylase